MLPYKYHPPMHAIHRLAPFGQETHDDNEQGWHYLVVLTTLVVVFVIVVLTIYM
jgi:hypothetical protein